MPDDGATHMKSRLRADLLTAMRCGRKLEVALIRELVAAIDNEEAPPRFAGLASSIRHEFGSGSAEVERLVLSDAQVRALLMKEIQTREQSANEFDRLGDVGRASALRAQALVAKRYVE